MNEHGLDEGEHMTRQCFHWYGSKATMAPFITSFFPPHKKHVCYVEIFGGSAAVLLHKEPSEVEVYNDIDSNVVNFFRILRDPQAYERFKLRIQLTPYSREEFYGAKQTIDVCDDPVERAALWFTIAGQAVAGRFGSGWSHSIWTSRYGLAAATAQWLNHISRMDDVVNRIRGVQIENKDWRYIIDTYDRPDTLFYLDPPYTENARVDTKAYRMEMCDTDHRELVQRLLSVQGMVVLSGYDNDIYSVLSKNGWITKVYRTVSRPGSTAQNRTVPSVRNEMLWINAKCRMHMR